MKKGKAIFGLSTALILLLTACSGGSNEGETEKVDKEALEKVSKTGFPIVEEPITIKMFTAKSNASMNFDWNDPLIVWDEYEKMTNINIEWTEQILKDNLEEKRNLALAGGTIPDVFYSANLSNLDIFKYGKQGTFIDLSSYIEDYAPNLQKYLESNPDVKNGITFPDGKIYSMPALRDNDFLSIRISAFPWINKSWLEKFGMEEPETTEEFYEYLKAVKEKDPNGNGEADEIPYGGVNLEYLTNWLRGSFGLGNRGSGFVDVDGDETRFIATTENYKELLQYVNKLYSEKLIEQNIFSIKWDQIMANGAEGKYGSTVFWDPESTFKGPEGGNYVGLSALKGPSGDQLFSPVSSPLYSNGQFVVTKENPNPAATVRWLDYFYSDEGARLLYMGIEDESFEVVDGKYKYFDETIEANDASKFVPWVGINPPGIVKQDYFSGAEGTDKSLNAAQKIKPFIPEQIWPTEFTYTEDENKTLSTVGADIEKYVKEMTDKFVSGDVSFDEWDKYVKTIEDMGLEKYMEVKTEAYNRFQKN